MSNHSLFEMLRTDQVATNVHGIQAYSIEQCL